MSDLPTDRQQVAAHGKGIPVNCPLNATAPNALSEKLIVATDRLHSAS
jgi:hypothetical protein